QELDAGSAFAQSAAWALARSGADPDLEARLLGTQALLLEDKGKHADAAPLYERLLGIRERTTGPERRETAMALLDLGESRRLQFRQTEAMDFYRRALAILERTLGAGHPDVALVLNDMGAALLAVGQFADALAYLERALAIRRAALGPEHPDVARSLSNRANA